MRPSSQLLDVSVVGLAFRSGLDTIETFQTALNLHPNAKCWAVVTNEEAEKVRENWADLDHSALLIVRAAVEESADLAWEMLNRLPEGPVAVLLANLPTKRRWLPHRGAAKLVRHLESAHEDVQVHLHRAEWLQRPPRLR